MKTLRLSGLLLTITLLVMLNQATDTVIAYDAVPNISVQSSSVSMTMQGQGTEANKIMGYGFEDWTGDADTTPNYFSSTSYQEYWATHERNTEIISSCNGNLPHGGNFYFHQNFYEGFDPCLGTTPTGINPHTNIGVDLTYPSDPKNNLNIRTDVLSDTMTIRFYFRTTGNWPNAVTNSMKFIRVYGAGTSSQILQISDDGVTFDITDHPLPDDPDPTWSDYHNIFTAPINWNDGEWHSVVMTIERLSESNVEPNVNVSVWWDNWNMVGVSDGFAETYVPYFGSYFNHITLFVNWGATYPDSDMGIDLDDIEIWEGIPDITDITPPSLSNGAPTGELSEGTTNTTISLTTNESAICKYSTDPNTAYSLMTESFSTTGGTSHSTVVTGLEDGQTYTYYVRCEDAASNANLDDYPITFSVAEPLVLHGSPADQSIHLSWTVNTTLPVTSTWQIAYDGPTGDQPSPISGIISPTRAYTLTGLTNYTWYTVTLNAMSGSTPFLTDTVRVMPTDIFVYLPLVLR